MVDLCKTIIAFQSAEEGKWFVWWLRENTAYACPSNILGLLWEGFNAIRIDENGRATFGVLEAYQQILDLPELKGYVIRRVSDIMGHYDDGDVSENEIEEMM